MPKYTCKICKAIREEENLIDHLVENHSDVLINNYFFKEMTVMEYFNYCKRKGIPHPDIDDIKKPRMKQSATFHEGDSEW